MRQRPARLRSRERDFGLRWRDGGVLHRVAWIQDTGELYAVRLGPPAGGGGHVELLAEGASDDEVSRALHGWREAIDMPDSIRWLRARARRHLLPRLPLRAAVLPAS